MKLDLTPKALHEYLCNNPQLMDDLPGEVLSGIAEHKLIAEQGEFKPPQVNNPGWDFLRKLNRKKVEKKATWKCCGKDRKMKRVGGFDKKLTFEEVKIKDQNGKEKKHYKVIDVSFDYLLIVDGIDNRHFVIPKEHIHLFKWYVGGKEVSLVWNASYGADDTNKSALDNAALLLRFEVSGRDYEDYYEQYIDVETEIDYEPFYGDEGTLLGYEDQFGGHYDTDYSPLYFLDKEDTISIVRHDDPELRNNESKILNLVRGPSGMMEEVA